MPHHDGRRGGLDVIWRHNPDVADIVAGAEGVSPPDLMLDVLDAVQSRAASRGGDDFRELLTGETTTHRYRRTG